MWVKTTANWISDKWDKFEAWMASWAPGAKTRIISGLGAIGSLAAVLQQYITQLPITKFVTAEQITIASAILFTLAFWFRGLGDRVEERKEEAEPSPKAIDDNLAP